MSKTTKTKKDPTIEKAVAFARRLAKTMIATRATGSDAEFSALLERQVRRLLYTAFPVETELPDRLYDKAVEAAVSELTPSIPPTATTTPVELSSEEKLNEHVQG